MSVYDSMSRSLFIITLVCSPENFLTQKLYAKAGRKHKLSSKFWSQQAITQRPKSNKHFLIFLTHTTSTGGSEGQTDRGRHITPRATPTLTRYFSKDLLTVGSHQAQVSEWSKKVKQTFKNPNNHDCIKIQRILQKRVWSEKSHLRSLLFLLSFINLQCLEISVKPRKNPSVVGISRKLG